MTEPSHAYVKGDRVRIVTEDFGLINKGKGGTVLRRTFSVMVKIDGYAYPIEMYPEDIEPEPGHASNEVYPPK